MVVHKPHAIHSLCRFVSVVINDPPLTCVSTSLAMEGIRRGALCVTLPVSTCANPHPARPHTIIAMQHAYTTAIDTHESYEQDFHICGKTNSHLYLNSCERFAGRTLPNVSSQGSSRCRKKVYHFGQGATTSFCSLGC
jgi:hypothetical protein